jgi:O-phosphoseryl-tRNA(Cys) synthetase
MLGIVNILNFSRDISNNYGIKTDLEFLKTSAKNIASKLDLSNISNDEEFFVYKNRASNTYEVFT